MPRRWPIHKSLNWIRFLHYGKEFLLWKYFSRADLFWSLYKYKHVNIQAEKLAILGWIQRFWWLFMNILSTESTVLMTAMLKWLNRIWFQFNMCHAAMCITGFFRWFMSDNLLKLYGCTIYSNLSIEFMLSLSHRFIYNSYLPDVYSFRGSLFIMGQKSSNDCFDYLHFNVIEKTTSFYCWFARPFSHLWMNNEWSWTTHGIRISTHFNSTNQYFVMNGNADLYFNTVRHTVRA